MDENENSKSVPSEVVDKLKIAEKIIESNPAFESELSASEIVRLAETADLGPGKFDRVAGTIIYIRKRTFEKMSRAKAFRIAFPHRSVRDETGNFGFGRYQGDSEDLSDVTLNVKAKRLESSKTYSKIFLLLQTSLNVAYGFERMMVLDKVLEVAMDDSVSHRDRHNYMKLFLDKTERPDEARGMEVNVNLTQNNISIKHMEDKLDHISRQFTSLGSSAEDIIETMSIQNKSATIQEEKTV
jgi:hypothetical protein